MSKENRNKNLRIQKAIALSKGIASCFPILRKHTCRGTGGTTSGRYCYSIWLRHMILANQNNLDPIPDYLVEIGPGDSIGVGLAALLSGVNGYGAVDVKRYSTKVTNDRVFKELVELFEKRENVPGENEFPGLAPSLSSYEFPRHILTEEHLDEVLKPRRIDRIARSIDPHFSYQKGRD